VTLLALVAALLIEQARALTPGNPVHRAFRAYARFIDRSLNGGSFQQGVLAWLFVVVPIAGAVAVISQTLMRLAPVMALLFDIGMLYLTMGFRQFSHAYSDTLDALRSGDPERARANIGQWIGRSTEGMGTSDIARLAIERGLSGAHRHVFGVIAWFAVFGAAGAVFYRLAAMLGDRWGGRREVEESRFGEFSAAVFHWCDWIPARLTAVSFAVVGDFEDALYCWRTQADAWPNRSEAIVLASGAGAIGVRLGSRLEAAESAEVRSELGMGEEADAELMTSAIGLIWRALVLWLFVILLVSAANWLG
jgi:cobalamin biosynthesis protein CobD/CbiB